MKNLVLLSILFGGIYVACGEAVAAPCGPPLSPGLYFAAILDTVGAAERIAVDYARPSDRHHGPSRLLFEHRAEPHDNQIQP